MRVSEYTIPNDEHLRYLGYAGQEIGAELEGTVDKLAQRCLETATPLYLWRIFDVAEEEGGIRVAGTEILLTGNDIKERMRGATKCGIMVATLGMGVEWELLKYQHVSAMEALIFNAACTALIEQTADRCEAEMLCEAKREGLVSAPRFSPGYGDLPLELQPDVLRVLDAERRLGITLSDDLIMTPRKSVTAVVALVPKGSEVYKRERTCDTCARAGDCEYRRAGVVCGG